LISITKEGNDQLDFTLPWRGSAARYEQPGRGIKIPNQGPSSNLTNNLTNNQIFNARQNRKRQTVSEGLLRRILRAHQLCGLKFRCEHPVGGFVTDFTCEAKKLVVEIDGGYYDQTAERNIEREKALRSLGWNVIRFTDKEVEQDAEAVARAIAKHLQLEYSFSKQDLDGVVYQEVLQPGHPRWGKRTPPKNMAL
jgi:very-short-patch-repair endonuclease